MSGMKLRSKYRPKLERVTRLLIPVLVVTALFSTQLFYPFIDSESQNIQRQTSVDYTEHEPCPRRLANEDGMHCSSPFISVDQAINGMPNYYPPNQRSMEPTSVTLCRELIQREELAMAGTVDMSVLVNVHKVEDHRVCEDWTAPHYSLMEIFASQIVAIAGGDYGLSYSHDCFRTQNKSKHPDFTTSQQAFPNGGGILHKDTIPLATVKGLCKSCLADLALYKSHEQESVHFSMNTPLSQQIHHCLLFPKVTDERLSVRRPISASSSFGTRTLVGENQLNQNAFSMIEVMEGPPANFENLELIPPSAIHPTEQTHQEKALEILRSVLPTLKDRLRFMAVDHYPRSSPPPGETESGVVIYMDEMSLPVPFYVYSKHIPEFVSSIHILLHPHCATAELKTKDYMCVDHGRNLRRFLALLYPNSNVHLDIVSSTAATQSRMILAKTLICPPGTVGCLLPALAKADGTYAIMVDSGNSWYLFKEEWVGPNVQVVPFLEPGGVDHNQGVATNGSGQNEGPSANEFVNNKRLDFNEFNADSFQAVNAVEGGVGFVYGDENNGFDQEENVFTDTFGMIEGELDGFEDAVGGISDVSGEDLNVVKNGGEGGFQTSDVDSRSYQSSIGEASVGSPSVVETLMANPPNRLFCQNIRGKTGRWVIDNDFDVTTAVDRAKMRGTGRYDHILLGSEGGEAMASDTPSQGMASGVPIFYKWVEDAFPVCNFDKLTLSGLCEVSETLNVQRIFFLGDVLQAQMVLSFWSLLDLPDYPGHKSMETWNRIVHCPSEIGNGRTIEIAYARNDALSDNSEAQVWGNGASIKANFPWIETYHNYAGRSVLVANTGAYIPTFDDYKKYVDTFVQTTLDVLLEKPDDIVFYRTSAPGHLHCTDILAEQDSGQDPMITNDEFIKYNEYTSFEMNFRERGRRKFEHELQGKTPAEAAESEAEVGSKMISEVHLLDVFSMTMSHPSIRNDQDDENRREVKGHDCAHDYIPGPPDWWNHFLFTSLKDIAEEFKGQQRKHMLW